MKVIFSLILTVSFSLISSENLYELTPSEKYWILLAGQSITPQIG